MHFFKVGELAKRTGLTVRTLHHYDEIELLTPSHRSAAGYRLYGARDVARLQQIASLRQLGFALDEIREFLSRPEASARHVVALHLARLREQIERQQALCRRLEALEDRLETAEEVSVEEFLQTIEAVTMYEKYYTPEQLKQLEERKKAIGQERIEAVQQEWPKLIAEVRAEMEKGTDPSDPKVQRLMQRWKALIEEFTGGDAGIAKSLQRLYQQEPSARENAGFDGALMQYVARAGGR
jgi:DNA-binding transcriptional MerR regulator